MRTLLTAALMAALLIPTAQAQVVPCMDRDAAVAGLEAEYGETVRFRGLSERGVMIELFVSPSGSWTMVVMNPANPKIVCKLDHGTGGHQPAVKKTGWPT